MINQFKKIVIIAPHPDDETLGVGGSIKRFSELNAEVSVLIVSGHLPPLYKKEIFKTTEKEAKNAFKLLGVKDFNFLKIPATFLHQEEIGSLYAKIASFITEREPDLVFLPFPDRHIDHRIVFDGGIVGCRPNNHYFPKHVLLYETLSETHWNVAGVEASFQPDFYIDITNQIGYKVNALKAYKSQIDGNRSRSVDAIKALGKFRGSQNGVEYAEAFKVVRIII